MKIAKLEDTNNVDVFRNSVYDNFLGIISDKALFSRGPIYDLNDTLYNQLSVNLESTLSINLQDKWL
jgi:hypothetical protein